MRLNLSDDIAKILDLVRSEVKPEKVLYIVGGAVRDILLGCSLNDLDFVFSENPTHLAKQIARKLKAGFFVLDDERNTARVVFHRDGDQLFSLDFVKFTGSDLLADLTNRDFTVNAIAISIKNLEEFIDPLGGIKDLAAGLLRTCSEMSLLNDPVRVLRGIRLALQFNFRYGNGVPEQMKAASKHLPKTSYERQRDEFFKILEGPDPAEGMLYCRKFDVFNTLIPSLIAQEDIPASPPHTLPLFDHTIAVIEYLDIFLESLHPTPERDSELSWWASNFKSRLGKYTKDIGNYLGQEITPGRSKKGLLLFGALLHDIGKPDTMVVGEDGHLHFYGHAKIGASLAWNAAKRLQMSNAELEWIQKLVRYHMHLLPLINNERNPNRREIYKFYKDTGEIGPAIILLSLADTAATYGQNLTLEKWDQALKVCEAMSFAWWKDRKNVIAPELFLDGNDLQNRFGLKPGRTIGQLLEKLEEAQATGQVQTAADAELIVKEYLKGNKNESEN